VDSLQIEAANFLKQSPQTFGQPQKDQVKANITAISDELHTLNNEGVTGITNQGSLKTINGLIAEAVAATNLVIALVQ
jgi:molybdenum cofactor biosynthesis enzyme MoaA